MVRGLSGLLTTGVFVLIFLPRSQALRRANSSQLGLQFSHNRASRDSRDTGGSSVSWQHHTFWTEDCLPNDEPSPPVVGELYTYFDPDDKRFSQDGASRCFRVYSPPSATWPMPVFVFFHEMRGGAAEWCQEQSTLVEAVNDLGVALVCANANLDWTFPQVEEGCNCAGEIRDQPCDPSDSVEHAHVTAILDAIHGQPTVFDQARIYFTGFSKGSMISLWASMCFADKIRGSAQSGSGIKLHGAAVQQGYCAFDQTGGCTVGLDDGMAMPSNEGSCDSCRYFPLKPTKKKNVVGEDLRTCLYSGCQDFLKQSVQLMDYFLEEAGIPHEMMYNEGGHVMPQDYMHRVAKCHGLLDSYESFSPC